MALILALFAWLISQAEKYYLLICCERKILFLHWKSTAHKTSEQCHYWFLWSVGIKPITQIPAPILYLLYPNTHGPKRTYFVSTFWKYRPFSETNFILLCWNLLSSRWAHRTRALHQLSVGGRKRSWIIYCWLIWYERKILFWLKIYDRLHQNKQDVCFSDVTNERMHYIVHVLTLHACKCKVPELT